MRCSFGRESRRHRGDGDRQLGREPPRRGLKELALGSDAGLPAEQVRRPGWGSKALTASDETLLGDLMALVSPGGTGRSAIGTTLDMQEPAPAGWRAAGGTA